MGLENSWLLGIEGLVYWGITTISAVNGCYQIAIILTIIIALSGVLYYKYNKITSIIIINTTSLIKVEINSFNKVVYSYSPTEKGADLLDEANVENIVADLAAKKLDLTNNSDELNKTIAAIKAQVA